MNVPSHDSVRSFDRSMSSVFGKETVSKKSKTERFIGVLSGGNVSRAKVMEKTISWGKRVPTMALGGAVGFAIGGALGAICMIPSLSPMALVGGAVVGTDIGLAIGSFGKYDPRTVKMTG